MGIEIKVPMEELRKRKLFLATPMYGGNCTGMFARSVADLAALCTQHGIRLRMYYLFNESLITRARNYCCDEFMRDDSTHMLFLDADIGFNPNDVLAMLALQNPDHTKDEYDILTAPYPKKCISWEKVLAAANKGKGDKNANDLEKYIGDFVFNPKPGQTEIPLDRPVEVLEAGTGFMMIRRNTLEKFSEKFPQYAYRPDHIRTQAFDGSRKIMQYFQAEIDPVSERYLSEDYWFCQRIQELGLKTWFCPWMKTQHVGTYVFGGSLTDLASVGASATADADLVKKTTGRVGE